MGAYYNENDPFAADWLRELIRAGHLPDGDVDARSIVDVRGCDLSGYTQCHFFAGIGGWPYALRLAGWPDDEAVWSGSAPCQPFSVAGRNGGESDERHLWPELRRLIAECRPPVVFGEQVAGAAGELWLAGVQLDLEHEAYRFGAASLNAASVGAPHIRQRLYWVGHADDARPQGEQPYRLPGSHERNTGRAGRTVGADGLVYANRGGLAQGHACQQAGQHPQGGGWRDSMVITCGDGKSRRIPAQPALFPLADGFSGSRVGALRGAGNAIVPALAAEFIKAYRDVQ